MNAKQLDVILASDALKAWLEEVEDTVAETGTLVEIIGRPEWCWFSLSASLIVGEEGNCILVTADFSESDEDDFQLDGQQVEQIQDELENILLDQGLSVQLVKCGADASWGQRDFLENDRLKVAIQYNGRILSDEWTPDDVLSDSLSSLRNRDASPRKEFSVGSSSYEPEDIQNTEFLTIKKFLVTGPDSDGDLDFRMAATVTNLDKDPIRMIRSQVVIFSDEDVAIEATGITDEYVRLEQNESFTVLPSFPYIKNFYFKNVPSSICAKLMVTGFTREFAKLGTIRPPQRANQPKLHLVESELTWIDNTIRILVTVTEPDDDGLHQVEWKTSVLNTTAYSPIKVVFKSEVVDDEEDTLESDENEIEVAPSGLSYLGGAFSGIAPTLLGSIELKFGISVYFPTYTEIANASASNA